MISNVFIFILLFGVSLSLLGQGSESNFVQPYPIQDVMLNPPDPECVFTFDGVDEFSGQKRRDIQPQIFFTYTPEKFRKHFKPKNYITCRGNLTKISGGFVFLNLEFEIYSTDAYRAFGGLPIYSQLNIKLLNGDNIRLLNKKADNGEYDSTKKVYRVKGQYSINRKQEKLLKKSELDKVRIVWGTGYEDYEIYELDFFINQFRCLE